MLLLTAILQFVALPESRPNDLLARVRVRIGHMGLTLIALVYVLISVWQH